MGICTVGRDNFHKSAGKCEVDRETLFEGKRRSRNMLTGNNPRKLLRLQISQLTRFRGWNGKRFQQRMHRRIPATGIVKAGMMARWRDDEGFEPRTKGGTVAALAVLNHYALRGRQA